MLFRIKSYLSFITRSTNEHDVHSPFVFDYVTQCLYKMPRQSKDKALDVLLKSMDYFNVKRLNVIGNSMYLDRATNKQPHVEHGRPADLIYFERPQKDIGTLFTKDDIHNDSMLLINNIRSQPPSYADWVELIRCKEVTVSIDFFSFGVLFFRQEQEKEHFTIRI